MILSREIIYIYIPYIKAVSLSVFIISWVGQFYGHHLEGKRPSFFQDLQYLLIGPLWTLKKIKPISRVLDL
ncbi:MAG: Mpo1-like protein [Pseudobdellovibrio sp.]